MQPSGRLGIDSMLDRDFTVIEKGDASGNGMVVRFRLPSGLEIFGLPTKNFYGGHWDLGPTWNYVVMADRPFLVDCGRYGQGRHLLDMIQAAGIKPSDLDFVLISHGHEDHDGGLAELVAATRLRIRAHAIYDLLIRQYPESAPQPQKARFPAKCWHCFMPREFVAENCLNYHQVLDNLIIDRISDDERLLAADIHTHHLPGHSPDAIGISLGDEALIAGDVILPDITPWPTRRESYPPVAHILGPQVAGAETFFGLLCYIRSLQQLESLARRHPDMAVFPAHRLYYRDRWNLIDVNTRPAELIAHHRQRCAAILEILAKGPMGADDIARRHFEEGLLNGYGKLMAANEIVSHCELLAAAGDVIEMSHHRYAATGSADYENLIAARRE